MNSVILSTQTKKELNQLGVVVVYLFGSRAQRVAFHFSDYDVGIVFADFQNGSKNRNLSTYTKIYDLLQRDIPEIVNGPRLDISFLQNANPGLAMAAIRYGKVLYESDSRTRANFEENVFQRYLDYIPLQRAYEEANARAFAR